MHFQDPFVWFPEAIQKKVFVILVFSTCVVLTFLAIIDKSLINESVPHGIVSFEFAGSLSTAQNMLASWGPGAKIYAALSLGIDFLFMVLYAASISLGCTLASRAVKIKFFSTAGIILAWAQSFALIFDMAENYALIKLLLGSENQLWPVISYWCAALKFIIVGAGIACFFISSVLILAGKRKNTDEK